MIYEILKSDIISLNYYPRSYIKEADIAKRFGVSRTPVREAIARLQHEGLINVQPKVGTYISLIEISKIYDCLYIRESIDQMVYKSFMEDLHEYSSLKIDLNLLKQKDVFECKLDIKEKTKLFLKLDNDFHKIIYKAVGKESIWNFINEEFHDYHRFRAFLLKYEKFHLKNTYTNHYELLSYIKEKDFEKLCNSNKIHLYGGIKNASDLILKHREMFLINDLVEDEQKNQETILFEDIKKNKGEENESY